MQSFRKVPLMAALALCAFPVVTPAGEAPAASAPSQQETARKLADARQRLDAAARDVAELSGQLGRGFNVQFSGGPGEGPPPRALLGVAIGPGGKDGANVLDVSPGGPAADAGIKVGDIITAIAGVDLSKGDNPGRALVEKMRQLEPEQKVKVAVLRDGKKLSFDIAPRHVPPSNPWDPDDLARLGNLGNLGDLGNLGGGPPGPVEPGRRIFSTVQRRPEGAIFVNGEFRGVQGRQETREALARVQERLGDTYDRSDDSDMRFGGAEFASLSERLGSYFGVKAGVLVVRAGDNSPFKLQDGDVILAIDGREASNSQQAGRILRSYQPGEKLTLRVQRDRKVQSIDATAPAGGRRPN